MFFDRLKKLCDKKGISPYKACTDVGLNRAAVAKWKNGSVPSGSTATKLADYFGVTTDYLLTGLPANIYECPDDENPFETEMLETFSSLNIDDQIYANNWLSAFAEDPEKAKKSPDQLVLNEGERKLIQLYRQVPQEYQAMVLQMIEAALKNL